MLLSIPSLGNGLEVVSEAYVSHPSRQKSGLFPSSTSNSTHQSKKIGNCLLIYSLCKLKNAGSEIPPGFAADWVLCLSWITKLTYLHTKTSDIVEKAKNWVDLIVFQSVLVEFKLFPWVLKCFFPEFPISKAG